jgi:hypothetical protein
MPAIDAEAGMGTGPQDSRESCMKCEHHWVALFSAVHISMDGTNEVSARIRVTKGAYPALLGRVRQEFGRRLTFVACSRLARVSRLQRQTAVRIQWSNRIRQSQTQVSHPGVIA